MQKSIRQTFKDTYRETRAKQDAERARKKAQKALEGTPSERAAAFVVRWAKRLFYTAFMCAGLYLVVMMFTLTLPLIMSVIITALGYTLASVGEIMLTAFCGLFFTLWMFVISLFIVYRMGKVYFRAMRSTAKDSHGD